MVLGSDWHVGQVFFSMLWFFLFIIWIWLLITVFVDIFRSHDLGGFAKALWAIFVIVLAAAEAAVALAIFLNFYNNFSTIDVERAQNVRG